jgi:hypothetical protein
MSELDAGDLAEIERALESRHDYIIDTIASINGIRSKTVHYFWRDAMTQNIATRQKVRNIISELSK